MPQSHALFYMELEPYYDTENYLFVHGGVDPDKYPETPIEECDKEDMLWIRSQFLYSEKDFGKIIVVGHTPYDKVVIDINKIEEIFLNDKKAFNFYLDNDCKSLFQVCEAFKKQLGLKSFPFTIASLAMKIFKEKFKPKELLLFDSSKPSDYNYFFDESYAGGRVEVFKKGKHEQIYCYDVNSLYPFVMKNNYFPTYPCIQGKKYSEGDMGIYPVIFNQKNRKIPPFFWTKSNGNGLEFIYEGKGIFTSVEITLAKKYNIEMKIADGVFFPKKKKLFASFVTHFYELRKKNMNNSLNLICKLIV